MGWEGKYSGCYARIIDGEVYVINMHVAAYEQGNRFNHDPTRTRKLLLRKSEINKVIGLTQRQEYTLVPLKMYIKNGYAKLLIGLGKGKRQHDRREDLKRQQMQREIDRALKEQQR